MGPVSTDPDDIHDDAIRSVVGRVLRAVERGEADLLIASVEDADQRKVVSELVEYASKNRILEDFRPTSTQLDDLHPTSVELLLEEEFEQMLTLTEAREAQVLVNMARAKDAGVRRIWERTLALVASERGELDDPS